MRQTPNAPANELNRIIDLAELDLDYSDLKENFKDLTKLAAFIAGTEMSLINLVDSFTQWTVAEHGLPLEQMPREDSVCQYTISEISEFEVKDLTLDIRFKDKPYVTGQPEARYYFGVPLRTKNGFNIGSLCVLDKGIKNLSAEQIEMLKNVANEIVNKFLTLKFVQTLKQKIAEKHQLNQRLVHDIRGPVSGIVGLAEIIKKNGDNNDKGEVLEFMTLIRDSGNSLLDLANEVLHTDLLLTEQKPILKDHELNLIILKSKLEKLFAPQARNKQIDFTIKITSLNQQVPFAKDKLMQITGNLISNAIKFTPAHGKVVVHLDLILTEPTKTLYIQVTDSGIGLTSQDLDQILNGSPISTIGTQGEQGYGFGLPLIKLLLDSLGGEINVSPGLSLGTTFNIKLPVK